MSAQFSKGDRVTLRDGVSPVSGHEGTREFTVEAVSSTGRAISLVGVRGYRGVDRFEKVEPEFVVGQQVSGDDYARLPVGTRVEDKYGPALVKVEDDAWRYANDPGAISYPSGDWSDTRTIARLPAVEPEDKDDLYVEPEPLKEDQHVLVWARVVDAKADSDGEIEIALRRPDPWSDTVTTHTLPDAIVHPDAGQVPPWVKPAQCTSLHEQGHYLVRCTALGSHEAHRDGLAETWTDAEAYGRVEVES